MSASEPLTITLGDQALQLRPEGCVFRPDDRTMFVADLHLGKSESFQRRSIPLPEGATQGTLSRLQDLVAELSPRKCIILGDLWHARDGVDGELAERFCETIRATGIEWELVLGNHDRNCPRLGSELGYKETSPYREPDGLMLAHDPNDLDKEVYGLAGHVHPVARVGRKNSERLKCFACVENHVVLPSFGDFTGGSTALTRSATALYVMAGNRVIAIE